MHPWITSITITRGLVINLYFRSRVTHSHQLPWLHFCDISLSTRKQYFTASPHSISTPKRKYDAIPSGVYTTEQEMNIQQWFKDTMEKIEEPVTPLGLTMPGKRLGISGQQSDIDKGLLEGDHRREDKAMGSSRTLKETVRRQEERLRKSELQKDIVQEKITSLQEQLSMRVSFQQHSGLKDRLGMHERLLEVADQQIKTQQELIKHLLEAQASTARQLALITQKLSQQPEQSMEQPQMEEAEGVQSNPGGVGKFTDASDYVLVSEDEAATS